MVLQASDNQVSGIATYKPGSVALTFPFPDNMSVIASKWTIFSEGVVVKVNANVGAENDGVGDEDTAQKKQVGRTPFPPVTFHITKPLEFTVGEEPRTPVTKRIPGVPGILPPSKKIQAPDQKAQLLLAEKKLMLAKKSLDAAIANKETVIAAANAQVADAEQAFASAKQVFASAEQAYAAKEAEMMSATKPSGSANSLNPIDVLHKYMMVMQTFKKGHIIIVTEHTSQRMTYENNHFIVDGGQQLDMNSAMHVAHGIKPKSVHYIP